MQEIRIELAYAPSATEHHIETMTVSYGATAAEVVAQSHLAITYPEVVGAPLGVFGKRIEADAVLEAGDRLEIYRPLSADPMQTRRQRAKAKLANVEQSKEKRA